MRWPARPAGLSSPRCAAEACSAGDSSSPSSPGPPAAQRAEPIQAKAAPRAAESWRAQATGSLRAAKLERLLLERHAFSADGRDILRHLVQTRTIDHLGAEAGVQVPQGEINALWDRLDRDARREGWRAGWRRSSSAPA